jgi:hypothetical protein
VSGYLGEGRFGELAWVEGGFHRKPFGGGLSPNVRGGIPLFYGTFGESPPPKVSVKTRFGENPLR